MASYIKTRLLIVSDTHGAEFSPDTQPTGRVDVAIHCGDLTERSRIEEFRATLRLLKSLDAGLKLVIAGNHDFTLDTPVFKKQVSKYGSNPDMETVKKFYGDFEEARHLFDSASSDGVVFLDEGVHQFDLANGALLTVFASPWTPSQADWGFVYRRNQGHDFSFGSEVDIAITHGPPRGVLDCTDSGQRAGCRKLFEAVARARPRLHCFGHIHEGWGARLVTWRDEASEVPSYLTDIDNERSMTIEDLSTLRAKGEGGRPERCCRTSHCSGDEHWIEQGKQTLFVNAAIQGLENQQQLPWMVDIELPRALKGSSPS